MMLIKGFWLHLKVELMENESKKQRENENSTTAKRRIHYLYHKTHTVYNHYTHARVRTCFYLECKPNLQLTSSFVLSRNLASRPRK